MTALPVPPGIHVEIVQATPGRAIVRRLQVPAGSTVADVLGMAAMLPEFAGIARAGCAVGIFGRLAAAGQCVEDGDRVELYRPLAVDPKAARRARSARAALNKCGRS